MKVWPIDPLVPRNLRLEVPEKLPQGCYLSLYNRKLSFLQVDLTIGIASGSGNVNRGVYIYTSLESIQR